ncbi:MAG: hypothetical protein OSB41_14915, partial [Kiritimatiellae bacterium]|nr:hypothetical protein [Kiritimatiellia bacterium]
ENLFAGNYESTDDVWRDLKLVARNAWKFNEIGSGFYILGKGLSKKLDLLKISCGSRLSLQFDDGGAMPIAMCVSSDSIFVCRKMTKEEIQSQVGIDAREKEVNRLLDLKAADFWNPVEAEDLPDDATTFALLWVDVFKHIEELAKDPTAKSRIAVRGDDPRDKHGMSKPRTGDFWSPVANLVSGRAVFAHAQNEGNTLLQTDFTSFYFQENIREDGLHIDVRQLIRFFPEELKRKYNGMSKPCCAMLGAMYGVDRAGRDAIFGLHEHMTDQIGLERTLADPSLFIGRTESDAVDLYADYSDDIIGSAPVTNQREFVSALQEKYKIVVQDTEGETSKFAGLRFDPDTQVFCHPEHTNLFVDQYERESGKTLRPRKTPMREDLRVHMFEREAETTTTPAPPCVKSANASSNWRSRCDRPDCSFTISQLSGFIDKWDADVEAAFDWFIGYLKGTASEGLKVRFGKTPWNRLHLHLHTDASLQKPRSQGGYLLFLSEREDGDIAASETFIPLAWRSFVFSIAHHSTFSSEVNALHVGVQDCLNWAVSLGLDDEVLHAWCDNTAVCLTSSSGNAKAAKWLSRAVGLRFFVISDLIAAGILTVEYKPTKENGSDLFTKCFGFIELARLKELIGVGATKPAVAAMIDGTKIIDGVPD